MHAADLGAFQYSIGALLFLEISCKRFYRPMAKGLKNLNIALHAYYTANPTFSRITPLKMSQLFDSRSKYPILKGKPHKRGT